MKRRWRDRSLNEKAVLVINCFLLTGVTICLILYIVNKWRICSDIIWLLFMLHFFVDAIGCWKCNHDEAVRALCLGCLLALMFVPVWLLSPLLL